MGDVKLTNEEIRAIEHAYSTLYQGYIKAKRSRTFYGSNTTRELAVERYKEYLLSFQCLCKNFDMLCNFTEID